MPPWTEVPYCFRIALYRFIAVVLVPSGGVSSALTNSLPFHLGPSDWARKSVLQGVEQPHSLTRFSRPSFAAACRMTSACGGVKLSITAPPRPAAVAFFIATELASGIGAFSVRWTIGGLAAFGSAG